MDKKVFILGSIFLILDQVSKVIVDTFLTVNQTVVVIKNFFSLTCVYNTGAAFSILEGKTLFLSFFTIIVLFMIIRMNKEFRDNKRNILAFGLLLGGTVGNLSDRLFLGMVRDFLKFKIFGYNFPVFNLADAFIIIGMCLLIISIIKGEDDSGSSSKRRSKERTVR